jgi:hypothetical protein
MSRRTVLELCLELIAEIIDRGTRAKDLKALSLAHRSFTDLCWQKRLFDTLDVSSRNRRLRIAYDTVERDPRKAAYIRKLDVMFYGEVGFNPHSDLRFLSLLQLMST